MSAISRLRLWFAAVLAFPVAAHAAAPDFISFDSGHVRPLAMSADGERLYAVNTPDNMLEIFSITPEGLSLLTRVPVGMEPVAVAERNASEVWVVNHLSDSVSVVSTEGAPRVVRTLLVGDEPRDIVFAGANGYAFITTAHRGQHRTHPSIANVPGAGDPQLTTEGVPRADVWVFDPANTGTGTAVGGVPLKIVSLFGDTPRALAVSPDRSTVYAAVLASGNRTATVNEGSVCDGFRSRIPCLMLDDDFPLFNNLLPGGVLGPRTNAEGKKAPEVGVIARYNPQRRRWEDSTGRNWNNGMRFSLPDKDVFAIDANRLTETSYYTGVGTTLFNMVANPVTGALYVSNSDAQNMNRFEGPGNFGGSTVQGNLAQMRVTVIAGGSVQPRHLNSHIDYSKLAHHDDFDPSIKQHSLSTPLDMTVSSDGTRLYVAAFGSSRIGVFDTAQLEAGSINPRTASAAYIPVSGGGPSGVALDERYNRLYVMTRFDNAVKAIDLANRSEIAAVTLPNPEPQSVVEGRPFLYDASFSSANGEASCASCHIFGDKDEIAWDLGNPDDVVKRNPIPKLLASDFELAAFKTITGFPQSPLNGTGRTNDFHPMKGPMATQTLRGMVNAGAMHWRGDRSNGVFGVDHRTEPPFDSELSFMNFIEAFEGLLGRASPPSDVEMMRFTDFQLQVQLPPNPVRNLDNSLTPMQKVGSDFYFGPRLSDGTSLIPGQGFNCNGCHTVDPVNGYFGTDGRASFEGTNQIMKIPHVRNMYTKVGMFGFPDSDFLDLPESGFTGDQVRGYGFVHDGSVDTIDRFLTVLVFRKDLLGPNVGIPSARIRRGLEQFMLASDTDLAPIVGQQVTLASDNSAAATSRVDLLLARARAAFSSKILGGRVTECDVVATAIVEGQPRAWLYDNFSGAWVNESGETVGDGDLRALAQVPGQEVTFTALPPGSGVRVVSTR